MTPDYGWFDRVHEAIEAGDIADLKTIAMLSGSLLDLKAEMAPADWEKLYHNLSVKMGIKQKPSLALVHD